MDRPSVRQARLVAHLESVLTDSTPNTGYSELHFGDVLQSFNNGVQLDVRVKLAVDFLKAGLLARPGETIGALERQMGRPYHGEVAALLAEYALDVATSLLNLSAARGLVKGLPDTDELSAAHKLHLARSIRAQVVPQAVGPRIAEEEGLTNRVAAPGGRLV
jgi:hypothetical protein